MSKYVKCLALVILFAGCSRPTVFVILRDVPNNPSFTVLPANDLLYQVEFASKIEEYIIQAGVKVVRRPASKFVETRKDIGKAQAEVQQVGVAQSSQTERFYSLDETSADYVVETYADAKQIKIVKRSTQEILSTFSLPSDESKDLGGSSNDELVSQALSSLGIHVRGKTTK